MKSFFFLISFSLIVRSSLAQNNLVPNWSFEDTIKCPNNLNFLEYSFGWINPTCLTPDFFHECNNILNNYVGVPLNYFGFQYAKTGLAYAGLATFVKYGGANSSSREYIQTQLLEKLEKDKKYCISFYVSLADSMDYGTNKIGMYLSDTAIYSVGDQWGTCSAFTYIPQIINTNQFLINKKEWIKVEGIYTARGGEEYITIGNFFLDSQSDTVYVGGGSNIPWSSAYYYIDDVSVVLCEDTLNLTDTFYLHIPNIFTPNADGQNDAWEVKARGVQQLSAAVYNRWGALLWQQSVENTAQAEIKTAWSGYTSTGIPVSAGTYYYLVTYTTKEGETKKEKGFLTLVR